MRIHPNHFRWLGAGVILASGAFASAALQKAPAPSSSADVRRLQEMAARAGTPLILPTQQPTFSAAPAPRTAEPRPAVTPAPPKAAPPAPPISTVAALANIALVGVTSQGSEVQAWLVDVNTQDSKVVSRGDDVEGYTVREIQPERVVFAKGDEQVTVRMGEKWVPPPAENTAANSSFGARNPDPNDYRKRGGWGGWGGGRGGGNGRQASGGGPGGGSPGSRPQPSGSFNRPSFGGSFNGQSQNQQNSYTRTSTSNPQEARRRGVRLVSGGVKRIQDPDPIFNPQTVRRVGSADGRAFGADDSRHTRQQSRASAVNASRYIK